MTVAEQTPGARTGIPTRSSQATSPSPSSEWADKLTPDDGSPGKRDYGYGRGGATFAQLFCSLYQVRPEKYATTVFRKVLYRRAVLFAPFLPLFSRNYFEADYDFIDGTGRLTDPRQLIGEISHYQRHLMNRGFLRRGLRLRVSVLRMTQLVEKVMGESGALEAKRIQPRPPAPVTVPTSPGPLRILCADDNQTVRGFYQAVFQRAGYGFDIVNDGKEALDLVTAHPGRYALVITDHVMPRMGGLEFVEGLRQLGFGGKIIVVSGTVNLEECHAYRPLAVDNIMCKPLAPALLVESVVRLIGRPTA